MTDCPPHDSLRRLLDGDLTAGEELDVADHIERCPACQGVLEELTAVGAQTMGPQVGGTTSRVELPSSPARPESGAVAGAKRTRLPDSQLSALRRLLPQGASEQGTRPEGREDWPAVPGYELTRKLGRGGMAVVYEALQSRPNRRVALKMIRPGELATPEQLVRFGSEGEIIARLQHPNIVQIYEVGLHHKQPYLALELVEGGTLEDVQGGRPLPPAAAAESSARWRGRWSTPTAGASSTAT